jgi:hypothetical protein
LILDHIALHSVQLPLYNTPSVPYHTTSYHTIPNHIMLCHPIPCHALPHQTKPYTILYHTIAQYISPYHTLLKFFCSICFCPGCRKVCCDVLSSASFGETLSWFLVFRPQRLRCKFQTAIQTSVFYIERQSHV